MEFLNYLKVGIATVILPIISLFSPNVSNNVVSQNLGGISGTSGVPAISANYDDSLASGINQGATTMTLVRGTDRDGNNISGRYCFTIDEGSPQLEYVCGTASGTSVTALERGLSFSNPNTTSTARAFPHKRGANVKITDYPWSGFINRMVNGLDVFDSVLKYASSITAISFNDSKQLISKEYADSLSFAGTPPASETSAGIGILSTQEQMSSGVATGTYVSSTYPLFVQNKFFNATSSATTTVPVTKSNGKLSQEFLDLTEDFTFSGTTTLLGNNVISGTTTISGATTFDGTVSGVGGQFGDGSDGNVTISTTTTLTSDMFYNNLTVNASTTLYTGGYRIYVKGTLTNNGTIDNSGGDGNNASGATPGSGGTSAGYGSLYSSTTTVPGFIGGAGLAGVNGNNGKQGTSITTPSFGSNGATGGACAGASPGASGTIAMSDSVQFGLYGFTKNTSSSIINSGVTSTYAIFSAFKSASSTFSAFGQNAGSGSGCGAGASDGTGGGGGGSGAPGGIIYIIAKTILNNGTISANGGNGGNGGNGSGNIASGGGGGGGGTGGIIFIGYASYSGTGLISNTAGTGGGGGTKSGGGVNGGNGENGNAGKLYKVVISY